MAPRRAAAALALLALAVPALGGAGGAPPGEAAVGGLEPALVDEAWLQATWRDLDARYGERFLDVGYAARPGLRVEVLFQGAPPADLGAVHPALPTVGVDASAWMPVTHGALIPAMLLLAQQVPPGIRPGAWIAGSGCTTAHVVHDDLGAVYILTAGHCVSRVGQRLSLVKEGDIGSVVAFRNGGVGRDYALVRIDPQHLGKVDASMVGWHGPQGVAATPEAGLVHHYGWGALTWQAHATRCRAGVTLADWWGAASFRFEGEAIWGDSGSGANTGSGKALGIVTHIGGVQGFVAGTRAPHALAQMGASLGRTLSIVDGAPQRLVCDVAADLPAP